MFVQTGNIGMFGHVNCELTSSVNNKVVDNFLNFPKSLGSLFFVPTTSVMVETSNYCIVVQVLCIY
jgi:hypothetical protein